MPVLPDTSNFRYSYDGTPGTAQLAADLRSSSESDLGWLEMVFGVPGHFGSANKIGVSVNLNIIFNGQPVPSARGMNTGYRSDGSTVIQLKPLPGGTPEVRAAFVAELAEIMRDHDDAARRLFLVTPRGREVPASSRACRS